MGEKTEQSCVPITTNKYIVMDSAFYIQIWFLHPKIYPDETQYMKSKRERRHVRNVGEII